MTDFSPVAEQEIHAKFGRGDEEIKMIPSPKTSLDTCEMSVQTNISVSDATAQFLPAMHQMYSARKNFEDQDQIDKTKI